MIEITKLGAMPQIMGKEEQLFGVVHGEDFVIKPSKITVTKHLVEWYFEIALSRHKHTVQHCKDRKDQRCHRSSSGGVVMNLSDRLLYAA
jgi:hypothetical protein